MDGQRSSYDVIPYGGSPRPQSQPWRIAATAALLGFETARPSRCRVLELGCGEGANLLPMALAFPESRFSGVDLSETAIARAEHTARRTGAGNIAFRCADLLDLAPDYGEFDFILAHGVYSWVPADVRERVMEISSRSLAPGGIAYISFNALPGWHFRRMFREMLLHHCSKFDSPRESLAQARWFLEFLRDHSTGSEEQRRFIGAHCENLLELAEGHLCHDELEAVNHPVYFRDFIAHAARHGLEFLSSAEFDPVNAGVSPEAGQSIDALAGDDPIEREQYLDFLKLRTYREVLLCHAGTPPRSFHPERMECLWASSPAIPVEGCQDQFRTPRGNVISTNSPQVRQLLSCLGSSWPAAVSVHELAAGCQAPAGSLAPALLRLASARALQLYAEPPRLAVEPGRFPVVARLARIDAENSMRVTNLIHGEVDIDDQNALRLLVLCDGSRDRAALAQAMNLDEDAVDAILRRLCRFALMER